MAQKGKVGPYDVLVENKPTNSKLLTDGKTVAWAGKFALEQADLGNFKHIETALAYEKAMTFGDYLESQDLITKYNKDEHFKKFINAQMQRLNSDDGNKLVDINVENAIPVKNSLALPVNVKATKENGEVKEVQDNVWLPQSMVSTNKKTGQSQAPKWLLFKQIGAMCGRIEGEIEGAIKNFQLDKKQLSSEIADRGYDAKTISEMAMYGVPREHQAVSPFKVISQDPQGVKKDYEQFVKDEKAHEAELAKSQEKGGRAD